MSDAAPLLPDIVHSRLSSNASSLSYYDSDSPSSEACNIFLAYQRWSIFTTSSMLAPLPTFSSSPPSYFTTSVDADASNLSPVDNQVGLFQPKSSFVHHRYESGRSLAFILAHFFQFPLYSNSKTPSRLRVRHQWSTSHVDSLRTMRRYIYRGK